MSDPGLDSDRPVTAKVTLPATGGGFPSGTKVRVEAFCVACHVHGKDAHMAWADGEVSGGWVVVSLVYPADVWKLHAKHAHSYNLERVAQKDP